MNNSTVNPNPRIPFFNLLSLLAKIGIKRSIYDIEDRYDWEVDRYLLFLEVDNATLSWRHPTPTPSKPSP